MWKINLIYSFLLLFNTPLYASDYILGQGYNLGIWNIAGYSNIQFKAPTHNQSPAKIELEHVALFVRGQVNQYINPFFEIEYATQPFWLEGQGAFPVAGDFVVERLYNESNITEQFTARLGKMLAPTSEWNLIHANPLVPTVNRPLTTYLNLSEFISGVELQYQTKHVWLPNIKVYYQPWAELLPKNIIIRPIRYQNVSGINLQYGDEFSGRIALSIQHADLITRHEQQTLFAVDGQYDFDYVQLSSQISYTTVSGNEITRQRNYEAAGYLQVVLPMEERWNLYTRGEAFIQRDASSVHYNGVFGFNFRQQDALVWKLEYVLQRGSLLGLSEGVYGSFGVMF